MTAKLVAGTVWRTCLGAIAFALVLWAVLSFTPLRSLVVPICRPLCVWPILPVVIAGVIDYGWRQFLHEFPEALRVAGMQVRANKLRSALTALGIIIGIVAVTLMGTAILGIDAGVERSLAGFGDDILYISKWPWRDQSDWWNIRNRREISVNYAQPVNDWIAEHPDSPLKLAVPEASWNANVIRNEYRLTNIHIIGTTADLARIVRSDMKEGRFFSEIESRGARNVVVVGFDVADALFPNESPIGQTIRMRNQQYTVVGVSARQGSFFGAFSWDSVVIMPLDAFARAFPIRWSDPDIRVQIDMGRIDESKEELRGLMRRVRGLSPEKKDDFEINSQQIVRDMIDPVKKNIALGGLLITGLALFVGAIGIMNITYVSVKERTKEIGTRKALGARRRTILLQFLIEAVSICLLGGIGGLIATWLLCGAVSVAMPSFPLVFSVGLVLFGLGISVATGIFSGFAPAYQASKLDPVVALRYE